MVCSSDRRVYALQTSSSTPELRDVTSSYDKKAAAAAALSRVEATLATWERQYENGIHEAEAQKMIKLRESINTLVQVVTMFCVLSMWVSY